MLKRLISAILVISIMALTLTPACTTASPVGALVDDAGRQVTLEKIPQRIVSHIPSLTEILFALGLGDRVVGVDMYSDYPAEAKTKASVGNNYNPSIESIVALNPDVVLTDGHSQNIEQLDSLKIPYIVIDPQNIDEIFTSIELIGTITDTQKAAGELVEDMRERIAAVTDKVKNAAHPTVFYTFDATDLAHPWTAGPGSFVNDLISMAGGENIGAKLLSAWAQMSMEDLVQAQPQIIIYSQMGTATTSLETLKNNAVWQQLPAIKQSKVFPMNGDLVDRSGPRIVQGLEEIARLIHPELFK